LRRAVLDPQLRRRRRLSGRRAVQHRPPCAARRPSPSRRGALLSRLADGSGRMRVAICGGGVIGASTAYFLSRRGAEVIVIESTGVACAASGKSGGFLALDWCDGTALEGL